MKKYISIIMVTVVLGLLSACKPEENNPGGDNNGKDNGGAKDVVATAIMLNKNELTLEKGSHETLTVSFIPSNATNKALTWVSSNKDIAEVTDGIVVGKDVGTTEIIVKNGNLTDKCAVAVVISAKSISLDKTSLELLPCRNRTVTATLTATVEPANTSYKLEWVSSDTNVATVSDGIVTVVAPGTATITAKAGSQSATCAVLVREPVPLEVVNLGQAGKWANINLGAVAPEDPGDYYAWGEVEPHYSSLNPLTWQNGKTGYNNESYKWGGTWYSSDAYGRPVPQEGVTKYHRVDEMKDWVGDGEPDGRTSLVWEDDAAQIKLHDRWRMPTESEIELLITYCAWELDRKRNGCIVTAPNGNSIFLPATGHFDNADKGTTLQDESFGYYWSKDLWVNDSYSALILHFNSSKVSIRDEFRKHGLAIRPVYHE